jgi:LysM repeat protein
MNKKFGLIILVLLALLLSACEMPLSTAPTATPPRKNNNKVQASPTVDPLATIDPMAVVQAVASQTSAALTGIPANFTPAPVVIGATGTATPLGGVQQPLPTITPKAPVVAQPTVQTARPATYTLHDGEFIFCLARRFNVDPDQTLALNGLVDSQTVYPGLTVQIPSSGSFPGARARIAHPATYTVLSGDTIYSVACQYGDVDPVNIVAVNGLQAPYTLTPGMQIQIP